MTNVLAPPVRNDYTTEGAWRFAQSVYGLLVGQSDWGTPVSLVSLNDAVAYGMTIDNAGGRHLSIPGLDVTDAGVAAGILTATTLTVAGTTTLNGTSNLNGAVNLGDASGDAITINGTPTFMTPVTFDTAMTFNGNVTIGNADTDIHTVIGVTTFRNAANTLTQMELDAANNRVIVGSGTPLGSDVTPNLQVIGRLYVAPESANDTAFQVRRSSVATVGFTMGVSSTNDFLFKDDSDTETFRVGDAASTYQAAVTGDFHVSDDSLLDGDLEVGGNLLGTGGVFRWENTGNARLEMDSTGLAFFDASPVTQPTVTGVLAGAPTLAQLTTVVRSMLTAICGSATGVNLVNDLTT